MCEISFNTKDIIGATKKLPRLKGSFSHLLKWYYIICLVYYVLRYK
jgi:hypothetical protein